MGVFYMIAIWNMIFGFNIISPVREICESSLTDNCILTVTAMPIVDRVTRSQLELEDR